MARQQKPQASEAPANPAPRKTLLERMAEWLDANEWQYDSHPEKDYISTTCKLKDVAARVFVEFADSDEWHRALAFTSYPVRVPEARRTAVADALNRINYSLVYGSFEMDMDDGEVRFRTVVESDTDMNDAMFERVLNSNLAVADRHFAPLMAIAFGNAAPATVLDLSGPAEKQVLQ